MATVIWKGDLPAIAQVQNWLFAGTWEATDVINCTIGARTETMVAGTTVAADIVTALVTTLNASTYPEFQEITWSANSANLIGTADTAGKPFVCTIATTETGGGAADAQTIDGAASSTGTVTTASQGPNDVKLAGNWEGNAVPGSGDTIICENTNSPMLYNLGHFSGTTFAEFQVRSTVGSSFAIGLPRLNAGVGGVAYVEYRDTYWKSGITALSVYGGANRLKFNFEAVANTTTVMGTGTSAETGIPTLLIKGTNAGNDLFVQSGSVGVAFFAGETANVDQLRISYATIVATDASVTLGTGVTLTDVYKSGGILYCPVNATTIEHSAGTMYLQRTATVTTANIFGGTFYSESSGTLTTVTVYGGGTFDANRDTRGETITNLTLHKDCTYRDSGGRIAYTNPASIKGLLSEMTVDVGTNFSFTVS